MEALYPYAKIIHLFLAIIFLGYIFFDVIIFTLACKKVDEDSAKKMKQAIGKQAIKIMPVALFFIIISGGMMVSSYIGSQNGYFDTSLQKFLVAKIALATMILAGVILNLSRKVLGKPPFSFMKNFHTFALICGFSIVLFAKIMFFV